MSRKQPKKAATTGVRKKKAPGRSQARQAETAGKAPPQAAGVVTIRKYANRRLYDTAASVHITQEDLYRMVGRGTIVRIVDAATEEDITNQTLATALIEHDPGKLRLMPTWMLHQMIRLHEQAIGGWLRGLWPPFAGAGAGPIPGWTSVGGVWPGGASPIGLAGWAPWSVAPEAKAEAPAPEAPRVKTPREESLEALRREVDRLLHRLGELEGSE